MVGIGSCTDQDLVIPRYAPNGDRVTRIGNEAFRCSKITSITISDSVMSIGDNALEDCIELTSVTIGNGVTSIGNCVFLYCSNLMYIIVEEGNTVYHTTDNCLIETASKNLIVG